MHSSTVYNQFYHIGRVISNVQNFICIQNCSFLHKIRHLWQLKTVVLNAQFHCIQPVLSHWHSDMWWPKFLSVHKSCSVFHFYLKLDIFGSLRQVSQTHSSTGRNQFYHIGTVISDGQFLFAFKSCSVFHFYLKVYIFGR